jgi:hypothetical protein
VIDKRIKHLATLAALLMLPVSSGHPAAAKGDRPEPLDSADPYTGLAAVAEIAAENGLTGLSPASLRPVESTLTTLSLEVAETGSRFVADEHFVDADGIPTRGNYFITDGYLYEPGTLSCVDEVCDGVVYDEGGIPSPQFPDRVIGTWTCYGTHTENGATAGSRPIIATTQVFDLGAQAGDETIVTSGFELMAAGTPIERAIVGGTGPYAAVGGTEQQTLLGLNNPDLVVDEVPLFGVTLGVTLEFS